MAPAWPPVKRGKIMAFANSTTRQVFPFAFDRVYESLIEVLPRHGFKIQEHDKVIGRIQASSGMSLFSWGENLALSVLRQDPENTVVEIDSSLKLGANLAGAHRHAKNFQTIIMALSRHLQSNAKLSGSN